MANHKSAKKRVRQTEVRTLRNRFYKTRIKNIVKNVLTAVEGKEKDEALKSMKIANKYIHHCVSRGILKKGTAARRVSSLQLKVNAL